MRHCRVGTRRPDRQVEIVWASVPKTVANSWHLTENLLIASSSSAIGQNSSGSAISRIGAALEVGAIVDIRISLVKADVVSPGRSKRRRAFKLI